jgi:hypothetical protein
MTKARRGAPGGEVRFAARASFRASLRIVETCWESCRFGRALGADTVSELAYDSSDRYCYG